MLTPIPDRPLAHLAPGRAHLLEDHLRGVAARARVIGEKFGAAGWAELAGLWHDLGKYGGEFQERIRVENGYSAAHLEPPDLRERDHSTAGAIRAATELGQAGMLLAFAIAGHHAGLPDLGDLRERLASPVKKRLFEDAMRRGGGSIPCSAPALPPPLASSKDPLAFEMWVRMIFSALVDADRADTEVFYRPWVRRGSDLKPADLLVALRAHLGTLESCGGAVGAMRSAVQQACWEAAPSAPGAFSLTALTGSGKTLSFLLFALRHAAEHGLDRIVVALPFTSLIEQVAAVYRKILPDGSVVEHHSALDPALQTPHNSLACENWDAPLVVTTTVQLLESLFSNRPSACRKVHNLARSVVVFDEAQTLSPQLLRPILSVLGAMVRDYGSSLVFSTATQPALARGSFADRSMGLDLREIVPPEACPPLRRCEIRWPGEQPVPYAALALEAAANPDVMLVTHQRRDARDLCGRMDEVLGHERTAHLSAAMYPAHRARVFAELRERKKKGEAVQLVATQLVEAGADISFRTAYRAMAGLDALAQVAGRVNREGLGQGELRIFAAPTPPPPGVLQRGLEVARGMISQGPADLEDRATFTRFFRRLYATGSEDALGIEAARRALRFRSVAESFQVIDSQDWAAPLVVAAEPEARAALEEIRQEGPSRRSLRALQRFTVLAPRRAREAWLRSGRAEMVADTVAVLRDTTLYDERFGLSPTD